MRYSLLDVVQKTLASMDGDEVNSVYDTTESLQVATMAEITYNDILTTADLPEDFRLYSLNSSGNTNLPLVMYRPEQYESLLWLKYKRNLETDSSTDLRWTMLKSVPIDEFLKRSDGLDEDAANVATMLLPTANTNVEIKYYNDRSPDYYTTFDDKTVIFSSIDLGVESTLQSSKSLAYGAYTSQFVLINSFTPGFDSGVHQIWLNETIALASARLRQVSDAKAEKSARKGWIKLQDAKEAIKMNYYLRYPNYGRK